MTQEQYGIIYQEQFLHTVNILRHQSISEDHAHEIAQQVWTHALEHQGQLRNDGSFISWLKASLSNRKVSYFRKERVNYEFPDTLSVNPKADVISIIRAARISAVLKQCSKRSYQVLILHYWGDLGIKEISLILGVSEACMKNWLRYARAEFKQLWEKDYAHGSE